MSFLDGADRESEKVSDGFHHRLEFSLLNVGLVLRAKRGPLPFLVYVVIKLGREGDGQPATERSVRRFLEGVLNRLGENFPFEGERSRQDLQIVEILHAGIGDSEFHKWFEFFSNDRFFRIGQQTRAREFQERGIVGLGRRGCDDVAEADVNLNGNLCAFEIRNQGHPAAFAVGILGYAFRFDALGIEAQAVLVDFQEAEFPKNMGEALRGVVTASEEISIPCRTIALFRPQLEEQRALQNENVAVTRAAQPEENALEPVLDEDQSEIYVALAREVRRASGGRKHGGSLGPVWSTRVTPDKGA
jgi:hypothetical protein